MKLNLLFLNVLLLLLNIFLVNGQDQQYPLSSPKIYRDCSSELSRKVRDILNDIVYPVLVENDYQLPGSCPLRKESDMLSVLESQKIDQYQHWKCRSCLKQFKSEEFIDNHLKNQHADLISPNATVCLGDYCEMFNCDDSQLYQCDSKKMEKLQFFCQGTLYKCFPPGVSENAKKLYNLFSSQICDSLTCDPYKMKPMKSNLNQLSILCFYKKETTSKKDLRRITDKKAFKRN
ncbi:hypothetical protein DLAC_11826 [Tieghemostelium lacteum]|uniref:C2H2-type domain-containing protein n=1 Tax=Tieghemostelium lacteum TaxID=361077 RepID=A0A151Z4I0_TIELA|nr:hypothetical protein DLAC_11826 [Tieghemostelium lacteum]|eukprot:KYQ88704.1 hypothetical protein DLAC_11826 [Tieghemostelium lacteum]